jgi:hypothetical protein
MLQAARLRDNLLVGGAWRSDLQYALLGTERGGGSIVSAAS